MFSRVRQNSRNCTPLMWCSPWLRLSPEATLFTWNGRQTLTPPMSSTTFTTPAYFISMKWSIRMWVCCSTVFHRQAGPP